jgi:tRNA nucleotidyltransferase/poly(A) polymerase
MSESKPSSASALPSLHDADWLRRPEMRAVFAALTGDGVETRAVGGAVRNALLGLPVGEVDLATTALPAEVMSLAGKAGLKAVPTGIEHGTVTVVAGGVPFEVTTLRRDVETFGRHASVAFTTSFEEDARRRDFTLNALYADEEGNVFDPLGGMADLRAGRVRFIGDAEKRIEEDYLRVLRFFRVHAYYGKGPLDADGLQASVKLRDGLDLLSAERVGEELRRILIAPQAVMAIEALFDYGLLTRILGGVPRLRRFERLVAMDAALGIAANASLRLAALAIFVEEDVARLGERLRLSNAEQAMLSLAAALHPTVGAPDETASRELFYGLGPSYLEHVLLAWAQAAAPPDDTAWRCAYDLPTRWPAPAFPLRGADLIPLGLSGPDLGEALRRLEQTWIASGFALSRDELLARAKG